MFILCSTAIESHENTGTLVFQARDLSTNSLTIGASVRGNVLKLQIILFAIAALALSACSQTAQLLETESILEVNQRLQEDAEVRLWIGEGNQILVSGAFHIEIVQDSVFYSRSDDILSRRQSIPIGRVGQIYRPRKTGAGKGALIGIAPGTIGMALAGVALPSCKDAPNFGCGLGVLFIGVV